MKDSLKIIGHLRLRYYDEQMRLVKDWTSKNIIVDLGLNILTGLLTGDAGTGGKILQFQAGTNGTAQVNTDTNITSPFTKPITNHTYPSTGQVNFNFIQLHSENNGMNIKEYGLINGNGVLFSRVATAPYLKTSSFQIMGDWLIKYTN